MKIIFNIEDGFTLIEVLIAVSISSIVILSINTIILSSYQIYENYSQSIESAQKSMLFTSWLKTKIDNSSTSYVSKNDNLFTIKEKDSNNLYKLTLYNSQGQPALGFEKYSFQNNILSYVDKEPIINGVIDLNISEVSLNNYYNYFYLDLYLEENKRYNSIIF